MHIKMTLTGYTPLLQHNIVLADPMSDQAKRLAAATAAYKKDRTDSNFMLVAQAEWEGGIYSDPDLGVYIPTSWITGSMYRGGVLYGRKGTAVRQGLVMDEMQVPLMHDGPGDLKLMWADANYRDMRGVKIGKSVVQRCRPMFRKWAVQTTAHLEDSVLDLSVFQRIAEKAGSLAGMGDYRPEKSGTFGRYTAEITEA